VVDGDEREVVERELALLDPAVRRDPDRVRALLHADFVEFGASGRVWDRTSIAAVTSGTVERILATDVEAVRLGPDAILVTFRSDDQGRRALRSSVWVRDPDAGWLLRFHQGTLTGRGHEPPNLRG
jgi:ribonuclease HI